MNRGAGILVATGLVAALVSGPGCAKKMLPPSPDRFAPHLVMVTTRGRSSLELEFDELIGPEGLASDSFIITRDDDSLLAVRGVTLGRRDGRVALWTGLQSPRVYRLGGVVRDTARNPGRFRTRFMGSARADTVAPEVARVEPAPWATRVPRPLMRVEFSETMDTLQRPALLMLPARYDSLVRVSWNSDWQGLSVGFLPRRPAGDSVPEAGAGGDTPAGATADTGTAETGKKGLPTDSGAPLPAPPADRVYALLLPGLRDLEGNPSRRPGFSCWTADSLFDGVNLSGRVAAFAGWGAVLFHDSVTAALAPVLEDGSYSARLAAGRYDVEAVADTDLDGLIDRSVLRPGVLVSADSGRAAVLDSLVLAPVALPTAIHGYRR